VQRGQLAHAQRVSVSAELAATLAHEISQPLGAIVNNAEAARRLVDPTEPKRTDLLDTLSGIINDGQRPSEVIGRNTKAPTSRGRLGEDRPLHAFDPEQAHPRRSRLPSTGMRSSRPERALTDIGNSTEREEERT
jgi:signal transduction histidine kinase